MFKPSKPTLSSGLHIEIHLPSMGGGHSIPMAHPIGSLSSAGNSGKLSRMLSVADKLKSAISDEKLKSTKTKDVKMKAKGKSKKMSTKGSDNSDSNNDQGNDQESDGNSD